MSDNPASAPLLDDLSDHDDFVGRHIGVTSREQAAMLEAVGVASVSELIAQTVPELIRLRDPLALGRPRAADDVLAELRAIAEMNHPRRSLIGLGYYGTAMPPVIQRNVLENPAWYTAYTPYQPEISQGRLEPRRTLPTTVADLTGLGLANAT